MKLLMKEKRRYSVFWAMKRTLSYVVFGIGLLLSTSSGWTVTERDVLSFISENGKNQRITLINTQGKILEKLAIDMGEAYNLSWSPDKDSIAYDSRRNGNLDIYVVDVKKKIHRQLTFGGRKDRWPAWSPNREWIAFGSERAGSGDLYRMDVKGENVKQLTNQGNCRGPAWSPDSKWIAFTSESSLFVVDASGKRLREIAFTARLSPCTWAPDGKRIAFISHAPDGQREIFIVDVNGENLRQLTRSEPLSLIYRPVWSPSGKWIAYISTQLPGVGIPVPVNDLIADGVVKVVSPADGHEKSIRATRGLGASSLAWVPEHLLSVSPSSEKQTVLWGRIKQTADTVK